MENVFETSCKSYQSDWKVVEHRKFNESECKSVQSASVVPSQHGKSVCFLMVSGSKSYIPLEPSSTADVGQILNVSDVELVKLHYVGNRLDITTTDILRIRTNVEVQAVSYDNPFGLL